MAQSLFKLLKRRQPQLYIDVLAPAWTQAILERMPEVREIIAQPVGHGQLGLKSRYQIAQELRLKHYEQAIVLPNSFKSALIPYWAAIPRRTGFVGEFRYPLLNDRHILDELILRRAVDRFVSLGLEKGEPPLDNVPQPRLEVSYHHIDQALSKLQLEKPRQPLLALCPGAEYGSAKRWPETYFAEVAAAKIQQGWKVWLFGSEKDAPVGAAIHSLTGKGCVNLCGRTALGEAIDLLSLATAVISNDSGLMHVAAALDKPLIALYGSSDPSFTPPLSQKAQVLSLRLSCSPCFKRSCPRWGKRYLKCLRDLSPQSVLSLLSSIL